MILYFIRLKWKIFIKHLWLILDSFFDSIRVKEYFDAKLQFDRDREDLLVPIGLDGYFY